MNEIATYMNDEIREDIHNELVACTPEQYLTAYCNAALMISSKLNYRRSET